MTGDVDTLARTLYGEARGTGFDGMSAVANVVQNRCQVAAHYAERHGKPHPLFGDGTPASCCKMPYQFSCWNDNDPNRAVIEAVTAADPVFLDAVAIAQQAVAGTLPDATHGACYYYAKDLPRPPLWAAGKTPCAAVGGQLFFNDIS